MKIHSQSRKEFPFLPHGIEQTFFASHEKQADINHGQTLKRLNERGGLSPREMLAILCGCHHRHMKISENAAAKVIVFIAEMLPYLHNDYFEEEA